MGADNTGGAREVARNRLVGFEDAPDLDQPMPSLPPRRARTTTTPAPAPAAEKEPPATPGPAPAAVVDVAADQAPLDAPSLPPVELEEPPQPTSGKARGSRMRASNVYVPVALMAPLTAKCTRDGLSHGELIITAIEAAYPRLKGLIHPRATAGGSVFASRRGRVSRVADGPLTQLSYRIREDDFTALDGLVEEFEASSRGHLITAVLTDHFEKELG